VRAFKKGDRVIALAGWPLVRKEFRQLCATARAAAAVHQPMVQLLTSACGEHRRAPREDLILDLDQTGIAPRSPLRSRRPATSTSRRGAKRRPLARALDHGDVVMGVQIPRGFGRTSPAGKRRGAAAGGRDHG